MAAAVPLQSRDVFYIFVVIIDAMTPLYVM